MAYGGYGPRSPSPPRQPHLGPPCNNVPNGTKRPQAVDEACIIRQCPLHTRYTWLSRKIRAYSQSVCKTDLAQGRRPQKHPRGTRQETYLTANRPILGTRWSRLRSFGATIQNLREGGKHPLHHWPWDD